MDKMYTNPSEIRTAATNLRKRVGSYLLLPTPLRRLTITVVLGFATLAGAAGISYGWLGLKDNGVRCYWPAFKNHSTVGWTNHAGSPADSAFATAAIEWNGTATWVDLYGAANSIITDNPNLGNDNMDGVTYYSCPSSGVFNQPVLSDVNSHYTAGYSTGELISVTAHEFGHSASSLNAENAGCTAVEEVATSVRWGQCTINSPQDDDIDGTNALYPYP